MNFHNEMVYGKKHINQLNYNNENYDFRKFLYDCFNTDDLENIHINNPTYNVFEKFGDDVNTYYHNKFYDYTRNNKEIKELYFKLIKEVILPYLGLNEALVQKFPSFRIQLPENIAIAKEHNDNSLGHPIGEINFSYTFTEMKDTSSIWIEKSPKTKEYLPIEQKENTISSFNGNLCSHFNKINKTKKTRISMDFRVLPLNYIPKISTFSHTTKQKFIKGEYYDLIKINI